MWEVFSPRVRTLASRAWCIAGYRNEVNVENVQGDPKNPEPTNFE